MGYRKNLFMRAYIKLMRKGRGRGSLTKGEQGVMHKHHIFPKSIFKNKSTVNKKIVWLTPKEHFQAHHLLYRAFIDRYGTNHCRTIKMGHAISKMATKHGKQGVRNILSLKQFEEAVNMQRVSMRARYSDEREREKTSLKAKERMAREGEREKISESLKEYFKDPKQREKQKYNTLGKKWYNNGETQTLSWCCPGEEWVKGRLSNGVTGTYWCNNGFENLKVRKGNEPPQGLSSGRLMNLGKFYNDGKKQIRVAEGCKVPLGFSPGRLKRNRV